MTDLGKLHYFLGIEVQNLKEGLFLCQRKYAMDLINRAGMLSCKPISTPLPTRPFSTTTDNPFSDPTLYHSIVGGLQYLTFTRPDLSYSVNLVYQFMHQPLEFHWQMVKRILRYLNHTTSDGLPIFRSSMNHLVAYSDADWAGCPDTRRSTTGYCVFLGTTLISWCAKKQQTVSRSSAESEYHALAATVVKIC